MPNLGKLGQHGRYTAAIPPKNATIGDGSRHCFTSSTHKQCSKPSPSVEEMDDHQNMGGPRIHPPIINWSSGRVRPLFFSVGHVGHIGLVLGAKTDAAQCKK